MGHIKFSMLFIIIVGFILPFILPGFNAHYKIGIGLMIIYSSIFLAFWLVIISGIDISNIDKRIIVKKTLHEFVTPFLIDVSFLLFWVHYFRLPSDAEFLQKGMPFVVYIITLLVLFEINNLYIDPLKNRYDRIISYFS